MKVAVARGVDPYLVDDPVNSIDPVETSVGPASLRTDTYP